MAEKPRCDFFVASERRKDIKLCGAAFSFSKALWRLGRFGNLLRERKRNGGPKRVLSRVNCTVLGRKEATRHLLSLRSEEKGKPCGFLKPFNSRASIGSSIYKSAATAWTLHARSARTGFSIYKSAATAWTLPARSARTGSSIYKSAATACTLRKFVAGKKEIAARIKPTYFSWTHQTS